MRRAFLRYAIPCGIALAILALIPGWAEEQKEPDDPVARLDQQLARGETTLEYSSDGWGYLSGLLKRFDVNVDSQVLVFSKTSFQSDLIGPKKPRALYFNDSVYVGYVQTGPVLEFIGVDPSSQRINFYTLDVKKSDKPRFERQDRKCTNCHAAGPIDRLEVQSTIPEADGTPFVVLGGVQPTDTDHRTPFEKRWGGWYVTGTHGAQHHMGNAVAPDLFHPFDLESEGTQNLTSLAAKIHTKNYLAPTSDIVALMTLEHQTRMIYLMMNVSSLSGGKNTAALDQAVDEMVTYMLLADETPLLEPVKGVAAFTETFSQRGPRDHLGRSLRDFDLQTRMFRYPLSYMVYSDLFDNMPAAARELVYQRIYDVLAEKDNDPKFARLSSADRRAVLEIVRDTKTNLPDYWR